MKRPSPVQTMFMSTSARESSSYLRSRSGVPSTTPTLIAATSLTIGDFGIFFSFIKRLQQIAIKRDGAFAEQLAINNCPHRPANQSLNLVGPARWSAAPQFALRARVSRTRQHCILRRDPALDALTAQMERQFVFNGRRTNHARVSHFNERGPLGEAQS